MTGFEEENGQTPDEEEAFFESGPEEDPLGITERERRRLESRRTRAWVFVGLVLVLGLGLIYMLREELFYFFHTGDPVNLGMAEDLSVDPLEHNDLVHVHGIARDMCIRADVFTRSVRFLYLMGSEMGSRILIQASASDGEECLGAIERDFEGRLINLASTGRYEKVIAYYREHFPAAPGSGPMYLLEDGYLPFSSWWYVLAVAVLAILWAINVRTLWRLQRLGKTGATGNETEQNRS